MSETVKCDFCKGTGSMVWIEEDCDTGETSKRETYCPICDGHGTKLATPMSEGNGG